MTAKTFVNADMETSAQKIERDYANLMRRKVEQQDRGGSEAVRFIQAALNVGMVLHWTKQYFLQTIRISETQEAVNDASMTVTLADVKAEEELLCLNVELMKAFTMNRESAWGFNVLLQKRTEYGPVRQQRRKVSSPGPLAKVHSPLFTIKYQAALSTAFWTTWQDTAASTAEKDVATRLTAFDRDMFMFRCTRRLQIPNKACGDEISYLIRECKIGDERYRRREHGGRQIEAGPGIERTLQVGEKDIILTQFMADITHGKPIILLILATLPLIDQSVATGPTYIDATVTDEQLKRKVVTKMRDESFLLLDFIYRKLIGVPLLSADLRPLEQAEESTDLVAKDLRPEYHKPSLIVVLKLKKNKAKKSSRSSQRRKREQISTLPSN